MSNACISQEKLLDTFDRAAGSRHGWIIELYARCGGMDIRKLVSHVGFTLHYIAYNSIGIHEALYFSVR